MARGKACSICCDPNREQVEALITSGARLKDVAASLGLSAYSLSRHRRNCLAAAPFATNDDDSQEIARWLGRAEQIFQASTINGDVRGMVASLTAALRSLEVRAKAKEREREQVSRDLPTDGTALTPVQAAQLGDYMDSIIAEAAARPNVGHEVKFMGLQIVMAKNPGLLSVFQRLAADPALFAAVQSMTIEPAASGAATGPVAV